MIDVKIISLLKNQKKFRKNPVSIFDNCSIEVDKQCDWLIAIECK